MAMNMKRQDQLTLHSQWEAWRELKDTTAREDLVLHYLPIVHKTAQRIKMNLPQTVDKDDLISWGYMGLLDALQKFDFKLGWTFETYALPRIRGAMIDGLRDTDWVPRSVRDKAKKLEEAYRSLEQTHYRTPTEEEVSSHLGMSKKEWLKIGAQLSRTQIVSLDEPHNQEEDSHALLNRLVDEDAPNQERIVVEQEEKKLLAQMIDSLSEKEKLVISLIYQEELTFSETAEVLGVTTGRISQIHSKAISRLREKVQSEYE